MTHVRMVWASVVLAACSGSTSSIDFESLLGDAGDSASVDVSAADAHAPDVRITDTSTDVTIPDGTISDAQVDALVDAQLVDTADSGVIVPDAQTADVGVIDASPLDASVVDAKLQTSAPVFNPAGGSYTDPQVIVATSSTPGALVYYTTDGSTPTASSKKMAGGYLTNTSFTMKAIAIAPGYDPSPISVASYVFVAPTLAAAAPVISPAGGTFTSAKTVSMTTSEPMGMILYTTDGSVPYDTATSTNGKLYQKPLLISSSVTITAVTIASNRLDSPPVVAKFKISP